MYGLPRTLIRLAHTMQIDPRLTAFRAVKIGIHDGYAHELALDVVKRALDYDLLYLEV